MTPPVEVHPVEASTYVDDEIAAIAKMLLLIDLQVKYVNNMQYVNNMCFHYWTIVWTRVENENSRGHCLDHTTSHIRYGNISS